MLRYQGTWLAGLSLAAMAALVVTSSAQGQQGPDVPQGYQSNPQPAYQSNPQPAYQSNPQPAYPSNPQPSSPAATQPAYQWQQPEAPAYRLAERNTAPEQANAHLLQPAAAGEHPMMSTLRWGRAGIPKIEAITDYTATVAKRERIGGKLTDYQYMFLKLRHKPFSVYLYFIGPPDVKGQEVIFVDGANNGKLWAHTTGLQDTLIGTVSLQPEGPVAMRNQMYPLTAIGILNLTRRLLEVAEHDTKFGECEVQYFQHAKVSGRPTTCIQAVHPVPRHDFRFHIARIFVDEELNLPIRFEAYDWPKERGAKPELIEEYTYLNLKLNAGLTDADFDIHNPAYRFH